ncbi:MAG: phage tail protein [Rhizobiaceae bacterium]|nr:phage tail protein [Rhizobiaceae bacterium]MCV0406324.1 phage tail protein [Rhizobiaceae bacterium]
MTKPATAKFEEMVLEVEFDPVGAAGTFSSICGLIDVTINRTSNIDTSEVPGSCDDESLPLSIERQVRSQEVTASGTGVWARQSHQKMLAWWRTGATLNARLRNKNVEDNGEEDDIYEETGPAILANLNNGRTKGQKVSSEIEIQWDGVPATTLVPAA